MMRFLIRASATVFTLIGKEGQGAAFVCLALFKAFLEVTFGQLSHCLEVSPPLSTENGPDLV